VQLGTIRASLGGRQKGIKRNPVATVVTVKGPHQNTWNAQVSGAKSWLLAIVKSTERAKKKQYNTKLHLAFAPHYVHCVHVPVCTVYVHNSNTKCLPVQLLMNVSHIELCF